MKSNYHEDDMIEISKHSIHSDIEEITEKMEYTSIQEIIVQESLKKSVTDINSKEFKTLVLNASYMPILRISLLILIRF